MEFYAIGWYLYRRRERIRFYPPMLAKENRRRCRFASWSGTSLARCWKSSPSPDVCLICPRNWAPKEPRWWEMANAGANLRIDWACT